MSSLQNAPVASAGPRSPSGACPCGQQGAASQPLTLAECCGRWLDHFDTQPAPDAQSLMRSRYSAFVLGRLDYLRATWHPSTCPADPGPVANTVWLGLEVKDHKVIDDTHQEVEFVARYKVAGRAYRLHETSRFVLKDGRWLYRDGTIHPA